jgi:uncharacterized phage-associated protein
MAVTFPYQRGRSTHAALWLLQQHGGKLNVLKLVKLAFFADRLHLQRYGRPIFGGRYVAMKLGPVSSELKDELDAASAQGAYFTRTDNDIQAVRTCDEDELSESDFAVLREVNSLYGDVDRFRLADMTHELKAWKKNYREGAGKHSFPLPYEDFFEDLEPEARRILAIIEEDSEARSSLT